MTSKFKLTLESLDFRKGPICLKVIFPLTKVKIRFNQTLIDKVTRKSSLAGIKNLRGILSGDGGISFYFCLDE